jgi:hypothetical protein
MWFDDSYHPNSKQHEEAFTFQEQAVLAKFNAF